MPQTSLDPELLRYANTDNQREVLQAVIDHGGLRAASRALDRSYALVHKIVNTTRTRAARSGYSPEADATGRAPPGYIVKGKSTYFDSEGKVRGQWVKTMVDPEQHEAMLAAVRAAFAEEITPIAPIASPAADDPALLNVYTFTDYHFNMLAWGDETGDDWDMAISSRLLRAAFRNMVDRSPPARTCVISQLGDFSHTNGYKNETPGHGHELHADSRFEKAVSAMLYALRDLIEYAAAKHERVLVLLAEGNHDPDVSVHFRVAFKMLYDREPRVEVIQSPLPYYAVEHGATFLGFHHGHLAKPAQLPLLFATDYAPMWGRTKYRYGHTGHLHHRDVKEHPGMEMQQHPTLAASDAYAARGGWRSMRRAIGITYHAEFGEVGTVTVTPEMVGQ